MSEDDFSRAELAAMWTRHDPVPDRLVEKVLVALATENLDTDYELLSLVERSRELEGTRGSGESFTITFTRGELSVLLRVSGLDNRSRRVDGWVTPARPMRVTASQRGSSWEAVVDGGGRFEIPRLPSGLTRFWLLADDSPDEGDGLLATPTFEL